MSAYFYSSQAILNFNYTFIKKFAGQDKEIDEQRRRRRGRGRLPRAETEDLVPREQPGTAY